MISGQQTPMTITIKMPMMKTTLGMITKIIIIIIIIIITIIITII